MSTEMTQMQVHERLAILRQKSRDNTLTTEEIKEAIALMREGRTVAAATSTKAKATKAAAAKKKAPIDSDDLLSQLDGI